MVLIPCVAVKFGLLVEGLVTTNIAIAIGMEIRIMRNNIPPRIPHYSAAKYTIFITLLADIRRGARRMSCRSICRAIRPLITPSCSQGAFLGLGFISLPRSAASILRMFLVINAWVIDTELAPDRGADTAPALVRVQSHRVSRHALLKLGSVPTAPGLRCV
ncbi:hypothetical protein F4777DRAFT_555555 [Nemania sp. FL0916]|nr:hypothetical protein F4777DRAFT_555555 [Nemania sp. FL0916]